jgi:hypothetical protein
MNADGQLISDGQAGSFSRLNNIELLALTHSGEQKMAQNLLTRFLHRFIVRRHTKIVIDWPPELRATKHSRPLHLTSLPINDRVI